MIPAPAAAAGNIKNAAVRNKSHFHSVKLIETIHQTIRHRNLISESGRVVVGVSGGTDSVALVSVLKELGYAVHIAHLNHQLRGAESDKDEMFVRALADKLNVPITVESTNVQALAENSGLSIEMAARQARHNFFATFGDLPIALAHHADDQAETFLLKLARGAGSEGLGGMDYEQQIGSIRLIRPMLDIRRAQIEAWLTSKNIPWREDSSNADERFLRNRVRHTVLPLLEKELNPNIRNNILRTMEILRAENEWMNAVLADSPLPDSDLPLAAQRRILRKWLFNNGAEEAGFDAVEQILALMAKGEGTTVYELNDSQRVIVEYGTPRFEEVTDEPKPQWILQTEQGTGWRRDHGQGPGRLPAEASFDAQRIGEHSLQVRTVKPGDRIAPLGMTGQPQTAGHFYRP